MSELIVKQSRDGIVVVVVLHVAAAQRHASVRSAVSRTRLEAQHGVARVACFVAASNAASLLRLLLCSDKRLRASFAATRCAKRHSKHAQIRSEMSKKRP